MTDAIRQLVDRALASNEVLAVVVAALLSLLGWIAIRIYTGSAKVAWAFSHQHAYNLQSNNPPVVAYTKELWVQNVGRVLAEEVEVILPAKPPHIDVWPQRHFAELVSPDGSFTLRFDNLNSHEHVAITLFQTGLAIPDIASVRWRGEVGKRVPMGPQQVWPRWYLSILRAFLLFGFFSFLYFVVRIFWH